MTETPKANGLESGNEMDTADLLKQADKVANAKPNVLQNYIVIAVLALFGVMFFFQWRQNSSSPDKLITIMERSVQANTDSLKVQEQSLEKIQEFSIRVPMEHANALTKIEVNGQTLSQMKTEQAELRAAVKSNTEAVQANTAAVASLIEAMKARIESLPKNQPTPPS
jgi:septal ring factor EnvC (AmiA/AmiB activator)